MSNNSGTKNNKSRTIENCCIFTNHIHNIPQRTTMHFPHPQQQNQTLVVWVDVYPSPRNYFQVPAISFGGCNLSGKSINQCKSYHVNPHASILGLISPIFAGLKIQKTFIFSWTCKSERSGHQSQTVSPCSWEYVRVPLWPSNSPPNKIGPNGAQLEICEGHLGWCALKKEHGRQAVYLFVPYS